MNDAKDIAKYIILSEARNGRRLANLRLNAILFLVQNIHVYAFLKPCFKNQMYAWECGPIVPDVYNEFKIFAGSKIPIYESDDNWEYDISDSARRTVAVALDVANKFETSEILKVIREKKSFRIARICWDHEITPEFLLKYYHEDWEV